MAWLLYAGGVLRAGGVLGADVVENSPPIIFWLQRPVLALGDAVGLAPWPSWAAAIVVASIVSAFLIHRLSRTPPVAPGLALLAAAVFLLLPGHDFGQREHVALILSAPWLIAVARRLEGSPLRGAVLWSPVILAAAGLGIKPHFALVWLSAACLLIVRARSFRVLRYPELGGVAVLLGTEVVAVALIHPSYFQHVLAYGGAYVGFLAIPLWQALLIGAGPATVLFAGLSRLALSGARNRNSAISASLLAGAIGFWLAAGLQAKGWPYHYLPAQGIALLSVGALLAETPGIVTGVAARIYRAAGVAVLAMVLLTPAVHSLLELTRLEPANRPDLDPDLDALLPVVRAAGREGPVFIFSTNIASSFPLVSEAGAQWAFRHPSLLMLGAAYSTQLEEAGPVRPRPLAERTPVERRLAAELAADLRRARPAAMLVLRQDTRSHAWGGAKRFNYLEYFRGDPQFAPLLAEFRPAGDIGAYSLLLRNGLAVELPPDRGVGALRRPVSFQSGSGRLRWLVDPLSPVLFGLCFGLVLWRDSRTRKSTRGGAVS